MRLAFFCLKINLWELYPYQRVRILAEKILKRRYVQRLLGVPLVH